MDKPKRQSFIQGSFVLIFAGILVKIIGACVRLPLFNLYGATGAGYYAHAYNIYSFMYAITTAGLPVAVAKMVAEANALGRHNQVRRIARVALISFAIIGVVFTGVIVFGVDIFVGLVRTPQTRYAMLTIAPCIFFSCIVAAIRGYFQGMSNMVPTAITQIIEAMGKLIFSLGLAYWMTAQGYSTELVVAGATAGVTIGTILSAIYAVTIRMKDYQAHARLAQVDEIAVESQRSIFKKMLMLAIPITVGAAVLNLTNWIDSMMVMYRLEVGVGLQNEAANLLYGAYQLAVALFNLPPALIVGVGVSIIPAITRALTLKKQEATVRYTETAFRLTGLLAFPCAFGMGVIAGPILNLLYHKQLADAAVARPLLMLLCPAMFFVSMVTVTNSILQAMGRERDPVKSMAAGGLVKLVTNFILVGLPAVNIHGAPVGTTLCYATITVINLIIMRRRGIPFSLKRALLRPFISAAAMGAFAALIHRPLSALGGRLFSGATMTNAFAVVGTIGLAAVFYLLMLIATKALPKEDILMLPKGEKIAKILHIK